MLFKYVACSVVFFYINFLSSMRLCGVYPNTSRLLRSQKLLLESVIRIPITAKSAIGVRKFFAFPFMKRENINKLN
jgi:hypothetical protein